jgi:hypothetical protein
MTKHRQVAGEGGEQPLSQAAGATPPEQRAGPWSPSRRGFLLGTGGVAAAALVGGSGWLFSEPAGAAPIPTRPGGSGLSLDLEARRARALRPESSGKTMPGLILIEIASLRINAEAVVVLGPQSLGEPRRHGRLSDGKATLIADPEATGQLRVRDVQFGLENVRRQVGAGERSVNVVCPPVSLEVGGDHLAPCGQARQELAELQIDVEQTAVQQDQRDAAGTVDLVVHLQAVDGGITRLWRSSHLGRSGGGVGHVGSP